MRVFDTVHAEPRDDNEAPTYRVNFWHRRTAQSAWNLDAHILTHAEDVTDVLRWVGANARGRRVEVFVETDEEAVGTFATPRTAGLVRLLGNNPNEGEPVSMGGFVEL